MAPVPLESEVKYLPIATVAGHGFSIVTLSAIIARSLYQSYADIPPAQGTRGRRNRRLQLLPLFAGLAAVSLVLAGYSALQYALLSYRVWADDHSLDAPARFYGPNGLLRSDGNNSTRLHLAQWLSHTPVYLDAYEIIAEKARRYWWGQQVELATIPFSLLLSIEGRRRNISFLWAYLALAHLVSLPYAQNLFYVALLLTPTPKTSGGAGQSSNSRLARLRNRVFSPKPRNWIPHPAFVLVALTQSFGAIFAAPLAAGSTVLAKIMFVARALTFAPLVIPMVVPVSWGTVFTHPHNAYGTITELFRFVAMASFLLQSKALALGLIYNTPDAHVHRHGRFLPFRSEARSNLDRTSTAFAKILGSAFEHPVVAAAARDVLLCGISLALWAATRSLSVNDVLASSTPFFANKVIEEHPLNGNAQDDRGETESKGAGLLNALATSARQLTHTEHEDVASSSSPREDQRARNSVKRRGKGVDSDDEEYKPSAAVNAAAIEGDEMPDGDTDMEAGALAWGLNVLGGLGLGSAGVFGAECISR